MESVIVISNKRIKLSDLLSGRESSCHIPESADTLFIAAHNDEDITIQFTRDSRKRERVLRNVKDK